MFANGFIIRRESVKPPCFKNEVIWKNSHARDLCINVTNVDRRSAVCFPFHLSHLAGCGHVPALSPLELL